MTIPKEVREKVEMRDKLNDEIKNWCEENLEMEGKDSNSAYIVDNPKGAEQSLSGENEEWCNQSCLGEDWYQGEYYWKMDNGQFLCMDFEL